MRMYAHLAGGAAALSLTQAVHLVPHDPFLLPFALVGALLPDIDHPQSFLGKRLWPFACGLAGTVGHRTLTHSALAMAVLVAGLVLLRTPPAAAVLVGFVSHILLDIVSGGVQLWWPRKQRIGWRWIRTGSLVEWAVVVPVCLGIAVVM